MSASQGIKHLPLISRSKNAALKQPKEITSFSRTIEGTYALDDSSLSYYYLPDADVGTGQLDLAAGFKDFQAFDEARDGELIGLLQSIEAYERSTSRKLPVDIITWRGIMTKLLTLPYDNRDQIDLQIVKFDGQIFIQSDKELQLQKKKMEQLTMTPEVEKMVYSGYKFETLATLAKPWTDSTRKEIERRNKLVVNNIEQYCSVVKTGIGKVKYCIGGEVDCCWDYKPNSAEQADGDDPLSHYVELKTAKVIAQPNQAMNFERKLYKTWAQCFLIGIRKIIYGFRDDALVLRCVEEFKTDEIPVLIKNNPFAQQQQQQQQDPSKKKKNKFMDSLKFFSSALEFIVDNVVEDNTVWTLSFNPRLNKDYLNLVQVTDPEQIEQQLHGESSMLTEQFRNWRLNELPKLQTTNA